jgi:tRNA(fMet)-specific endonuclease VapC
MILFDTDTCIGILRGYKSVLSRRRIADDEIAVSFMTVAELYYGAEKSSSPGKNYHLIEQFLLSVTVINTDMIILQEFGKLKAVLENQGNPLADADLLIAATCLTKCDLLVTGNTKHYNRISGLKLDNWLR